MGDHTEALEIKFDPEAISYPELIALFWESHNPVSRSWSRQYQAFVFTHTPEQARIAHHSRDLMALELNRPILTEIAPASVFYPAEAYHQKYRLRQSKTLYQELSRLYPHEADLLQSTVAARVNGYLAGFGSRADLRDILPSLNLTAESQKRLLARLEG